MDNNLLTLIEKLTEDMPEIRPYSDTLKKYSSDIQEAFQLDSSIWKPEMEYLGKVHTVDEFLDILKGHGIAYSEALQQLNFSRAVSHYMQKHSQIENSPQSSCPHDSL